MSRYRIGVLAALLVLAQAGSSRAALQVNSFDMQLFGRWWHVTSYYVADDLLASPGDNAFLKPEGIAFDNNTLYVSGDARSFYSDNRLATYQAPPGGILTYNGYIGLNIGDPDGWGPDGLAFNTSGSGYGSGANELVSVEKDNTGRVGVIDLATGDVSSVQSITAAEALVFADSANEFGTCEDAGGPVTVRYYDSSFAPTGSTATVAPGTQGAVAVSSVFAGYLAGGGDPGPCLLTVTKANPGNAVNLYDLAGNSVVGQQDLPEEPEARIPIGGGFYLTKPAFGGVEAITADESANLIYIGDADNSMVHVLTPGALIGDLDYDGDVDLADLAVLLAHYGQTSGAAYEDGDLDGDGDVDLADLAMMLAVYGHSD